jgi:DNA integrity scanning protein DisA with diadenylate cyclase activity
VSRRELLALVSGRTVDELDPTVLRALATLDGAIVMDGHGTLIACGAILRHPPSLEVEEWVAEGARTTAAMAASRFGPVLKVSEDGVITFFDREKIWDI